MAGFADAQELEVDAAKALNQAFVIPTLFIEIFGGSVWEMSVPAVDIHLTKQLTLHVVAIRVWIGRAEANVLVEIKGFAQREIEAIVLMHADQTLVNLLHGGAGGEAKNQVWIGPEFIG